VASTGGTAIHPVALAAPADVAIHFDIGWIEAVGIADNITN